MKSFCDLFVDIKYNFQKPTVDNIIWLINLTPKKAGFSILKRKDSIVFWITHFTLLLYVNFVSNFIYPIMLSNDVNGIIKANTNLSVFIFTINIGWWFLTKRSLLISTMNKLRKLDKLSLETEFISDKHTQLLKKIKILVLIYYFINFANILLIWMPQRWDLSGALYTPYPCPGIAVTTDLNKYICRSIILTQDAIMAVVVINYQSLLLFFIAHTAAMFKLLSEEMEALKRFEVSYTAVKERLPLLVQQHILLLYIVDGLKSLYNMPLGIDFGANAYCICLFFSLPLEEWISFVPVLGYCFIVFFLYCYLCQKLIDLSNIFENSVYDCGWENYAISDRKTVYLILIMAQKPVLLHAGGIIPVNIYTFATAMQGIYKFVTAVKF